MDSTLFNYFKKFYSRDFFINDRVTQFKLLKIKEEIADIKK